MNVDPLVSVVIPVFDTRPEYLAEALNSVVAQTLDSDLIEVIIVDDFSSNPMTCEFLDTIGADDFYQGVKIRVIRHDKNRWLAQARNTGLDTAAAPCILFLDSDDYIGHDYLNKGVLLLQANPDCSWVYPNTFCFGKFSELRPAKSFSPFRLLLRNYIPYASIFRTREVRNVRYREKTVVPGIRFFEDWDFTIRMMCKGRFGMPLQDGTFFHRRESNSLHERPAKLYLLSIYKTWISNSFRLPLMVRAFIRNSRWRRKAQGISPIYSPIRLIDKIQAWFIRESLESPDIQVGLDLKSLLMAATYPPGFSKRFLDSELTVTLAEIKSGFRRKPNLTKFRDVNQFSSHTAGKTIMFAHTWWVVGGAEKVLLEWIGASSMLPGAKIIDVCQFGKELDQDTKEAFAAISTEQFCLEGIGDTPLARLAFCWRLICHQRPALVFISGNSFFYTLVPKIKQFFPETTIVDILHNEWNDHMDWFGVAHEYRDKIDYRIVVSPYWKDVLIDKYNEQPQRVIVVENGIDIEQFDPDRSNLISREQLGLPAKVKIVSFVGRLHPQKNPALFINLAIEMQSHDNFHFLVVGDGELRDLLAPVSSLNNITFLGVTHDIPSILAVTDILICTSRYEGFPLVTLEAAAMNVAVITPHIVGFREQLCQGNFGMMYLTRGDNNEDCASIAAILIENDKKLGILAENGRPFIKRMYDSKSINRRRQELMKTWLGMQGQKGRLPRRNKKPLFLHIGIHKTGTTTIQRFLYENNLELSMHGLYYPADFLFGYAHHALANFFKKNKELPEFIKDRFVNRENWAEAIILHLKNVLNHSSKRLVYSSEIFSLARPELLAGYLKSFDVKIFIFLRRQDQWFESAYNQNLKINSTIYKELESFVDSREYRGKYFRLLNNWAKHFGRDNLIVTPFEFEQYGGDLIKHFVNLIGIPWSESFRIPPSINLSLNRDCIAYLQQFPTKGKLKNHRFHRITDCLEMYSKEFPDPPQFKYASSPEQRIQIIEKYQKQNENVAREYLDREDGILFYDEPPSLNEPWAPYPGINEESQKRIERHLNKNGLDMLSVIDI